MAVSGPALRGRTLQRGLAHAAIIGCCAGGLLAWTAVIAVGRHSEVFVQDWTVYYAAGHAWLEHRLPLIFDAERFTAFQYEMLAGWYGGPPTLHPWLYPPHYLLLLAPFALLPFALSYAAFQVATGFAAVAALAWRGTGRGMAWTRGIMLLFFPASCINMLTGQNALLTVALAVGGFRLAERRPMLGGALLGALSIKPHFFLLVPVALAARRAWRALAACGLAALLLVLASIALFGMEPWRLWLDRTVFARDPAFSEWFAETFLRGYSLYVCAALLGAAENIARLAQVAAALGAGIGVWLAFRRPASTELRLAAWLVAALVAAPHVMAYDLLWLGAAVILLFGCAADGIGFGAVALFALAWAAPMLRPSMTASGRVLVPIALIGLFAYALDRALAWRKRTAPAAVYSSTGPP